MTAVVISQPMLFPWPGFFEQMMLADVYLWLDDAQFSKGSFTNRIQVRYGATTKWLSIPLAGKGSFQSIHDLVPAEDFRLAHKTLLKQSLADAPFAADALAIVEQVYGQDNLCDLLIASAEVPARWMGLAQHQTRGRTSLMNAGAKSWQRVLDLVRSTGGTRYLTGHGAADYLDHQAFEDRGVAVEYMMYSKTAWRSTSDFTPYVSVLDLIANKGRDAIDYLHPATLGWRDFLASKEPR